MHAAHGFVFNLFLKKLRKEPAIKSSTFFHLLCDNEFALQEFFSEH